MKPFFWHGHRCLFCQWNRVVDRTLCTPCHHACPYRPHTCLYCPQCLGEKQAICGHCMHTPPPWQQCIAPFFYSDTIQRGIQQFKYHHDHAWGHWMTEQLIQVITQQHQSWPDLLIPVPMHRRRLGYRGFNQAFEIAKIISKQLGIPMSRHHCLRSVETLTQSSLPIKNRKRHLKNAFTAALPCPAHIAIIDDVITSGSTVRSMIKVLKKNGATHIDVWCLATTQHAKLMHRTK